VIELNFGHHYAYIKAFNLEFENFKIDVYGLNCVQQLLQYVWKKILIPLNNLGCPCNLKNI
jgi:hypothetical protein